MIKYKDFTLKAQSYDKDKIHNKLTQLGFIFEGEEFLKIFNEAIKLPIIEFSGYKEGKHKPMIFSTEIYLELID